MTDRPPTDAGKLVLRAVVPVLGPIAARAGELVVLTPDHPTHTLAVLDATASAVRRFLAVPRATWQHALASLLEQGSLEFLNSASRATWHALCPGVICAPSRAETYADKPTMAFRILRPIRSPLAAQPSDTLVAWPGHPTHTLGVVSPQPRRVLRTLHVPDRQLYRRLFHWYLDGRIRPANVATERALLGVTDA